jgi:hypothetical protein
MGTALKSARAFLTLLSLALFCSGCQANHSPEAPSSIAPNVSGSSMSETLRMTAAQTSGAQAAGNTNGAAGQMPAYYDGQVVTVNMKEMPDKASDSTIEKNTSINEIYASNDLDEEQDFIPVIDAIQGDGFNPLWRQILIVFNAGFTPTSSSRTKRSGGRRRVRDHSRRDGRGLPLFGGSIVQEK